MRTNHPHFNKKQQQLKYHSPYEVTVTTSYKGIDLNVEAYISGKVAYKLITE